MLIFLPVFKLFSGLSIVITTYVGITIARHYQTNMRLISKADSFTRGVFLGAALFHLLPSAEANFNAVQITASYPYLLAHWICLMGFLSFFTTEQFIYRRSLKCKNTSTTLPWIVILLLSCHSIIAGITLGSTTSIRTASVILISIILHKCLASFALTTHLLRKVPKPNQRHCILMVFIMMTPTGIAFASIIHTILNMQTLKLVEASLNAVAAGSFLYLGTFHNPIQPTIKFSKHFIHHPIAILTGIVSMALL